VNTAIAMGDVTVYLNLTILIYYIRIEFYHETDVGIN
jgi:hypothetical protein